MNFPTLQDVLTSLHQHRQFQRRVAGVAKPRCYEIFSVAGPHRFYVTAPTLKFALKLAESEARQEPGTVVSVWSPLRCHVYQAVVQDDRYCVLHSTEELR